MSAQARRLWVGAGLALVLLVLVLWNLPVVRIALSFGAAPEIEADVCVVAPPTPYNPASGLPLQAARPVPADVRCPVCGMYPARSPDWAAQVIFANGDAQFFDSPLSLFMYLGDVARYSPGRSADEIVAHYVTDVPSRSWVDARSAFYVTGSTAKGPMRAGNLPAFASQDAARQFAAQRGGKVLAYADVDAGLVAQLGGQGVHAH
ncbi:MAG: nitrous oxide reductase accessory protein NosL [Burkholderiaceae bacterium]|jgi:copper chaperone NosL|nr:nitrous oxide reductase accessory protein NosL [Burkholderiaceae bacterium]MCB1987592.1 nitrous oxide reductase accessory protein NosL [Burkholderiaceae bacterium]